MIVLPVWVMICFVTPFIGSALESILICVFSLHDQRKAYKAKLRAEFEAELSPIERAFRSGEEGIEKENIDADT